VQYRDLVPQCEYFRVPRGRRACLEGQPREHLDQHAVHQLDCHDRRSSGASNDEVKLGNQVLDQDRLPGTVTGWVKSAAGWYCRIRYRYSETRDAETWVEFNPQLVLRLSVDREDLKNWLPQRPIG
jgi:hypothetical protein